MFGIWESILAYLTRQMGLRGDAADAAGSLHAKVSNVNNNVVTVNNKVVGWASKLPRFASTYANDMAVSGSATLFSLTGAGFLTGLTLQLDNPRNIYVRLVITIDGTTCLDTGTATGGSFVYITADYDNADTSITTPMLHRFNSSASIVLYNQDTVNSLVHVRATLSYLLD